MFEQFSIYPRIKWMATAAAQFIGAGDKIQINSDLKNFKLERFKDLRYRPKGGDAESFKLMLVGSSKTNIFIDGPDSLIDVLVTKLPSYIGKSWIEINQMKLERSCTNCNNFIKGSLCDPWIIDKFEFKEMEPNGEISYFNTEDLSETDQICVNCNNFEEK